MRRATPIFLAFTVALSALAQEKTTYQDHVRPIFNTSCVSCHNPDKNKAGLDLTSYAATMKGSSNGKILDPGDPDSSLIYLLVTHQEEPHMPAKAGKLPDAQLETIKKWIAGGALESAGATVAVASKPNVELKLSAAPSAKPQGAPPMPKDLSLQPIVRSERPAAPGALAASPWASLIAVSSPHQILLHHAQTLDLLGVLPFPEGLPKVLRFSRNGALILAAGGVGGQSGRAVLYDVVSGRRVAEVGEEFDEVLAADITPDQSCVALGGPGKILKIYSLADAKPLHKLTQHTDWITAVAYSPDGVLLASGDRNGGLRVWEAAAAAEFYTLNGHKGAITRLCFRSDSNVLASASEDGTVKLWDMNSGAEIKSIAAHGSGVMSVDFAPEGRLVTAGRDHIVRTWDAAGTKLADFPLLGDIALHAVFANQGTIVVAAAFNGQVVSSASTDSKPLAITTTSPPTIAERLVEARAKVSAAEAAAAKASVDLSAAQAAAGTASAEFQAVQSSVQVKQKAVEQAQAALASLSAAQPPASQPATAPTTQASSGVAAATDALQNAQAQLAAATAALAPVADKAKATDAARAAAQGAADAAHQALAAAQANLKKWKIAEISNQLALARQELQAMSTAQSQLAADIKEIEAVTRTLADGPKRIEAAQQEASETQKLKVAATQAASAAKSALAEREAVVKQATELHAALAAQAAKSPADATAARAAQHARQTLDVLVPTLDSLKSSATAADATAQKATAAAAAAEIALAKLKTDLLAAPNRLQQARQRVDAVLGQQLQAVQKRVEKLTAEHARLTEGTVP